MQPIQHDAPTGPVLGLVSGAIANMIGLDTIATVLTALACGFAGAAGQMLFKRIVHAYNAKRNEKN